MRRTRLVFAPAQPEAPPRYLMLDEAGEVIARGELGLRPDAAPGERVVLAAPGVEAVVRWLEMPARTEAQAGAAAALLLQDQRAFGDEDLHVAVGPLEADGRRLAVAAGAARMQAWLGLARLYGLSPDVVIPDYLLIPEPAAEAPTAVRLGGALAVRGHRLAFACEPELAPVLLEDRIPEVVEADEAVERLLAAGALSPAVNLLQGRFAPVDRGRIRLKDVTRAAAIAALLLVSPVLLNAATTVRLNLAASEIEQQTADLAAAALPKGTALTDPAAQVAARLERVELAAGGGPAGLAARLFTALSDIDQAQVEGLMLSPDGAMRATISHVNYSDVGLLTEALRGHGVALREEASREESGRIVSDVILGARR